MCKWRSYTKLFLWLMYCAFTSKVFATSMEMDAIVFKCLQILTRSEAQSDAAIDRTSISNRIGASLQTSLQERKQQLCDANLKRIQQNACLLSEIASWTIRPESLFNNVMYYSLSRLLNAANLLCIILKQTLWKK